MTLGIRPEHLMFQSEGGIAARVQLVERLGSESYLHAETPDGQMLIAKVSGDADVEIGREIYLGMHEKYVHLFDSVGNALRRPV